MKAQTIKNVKKTNPKKVSTAACDSPKSPLQSDQINNIPALQKSMASSKALNNQSSEYNSVPLSPRKLNQFDNYLKIQFEKESNKASLKNNIFINIDVAKTQPDKPTKLPKQRVQSQYATPSPQRKIHIRSLSTDKQYKQPLSIKNNYDTQRSQKSSNSTGNIFVGHKRTQTQQSQENRNQSPKRKSNVTLQKEPPKTPKSTKSKNGLKQIDKSQVSVNKQKLNQVVTKMKKGQTLPFQAKIQEKEKDRPLSNQRQKNRSSNTPSTQKSTISSQQQSNNRLTQEPRKQVTVDPFLPAFKGCKYYLSQMLHFNCFLINNKQSPFEQQFKQAYPSDELSNYFEDIYQEHFSQSFYSLKFCKSLVKPSFDSISSKVARLPSQSKKKRTIVFDLDETLIHCNDNEDDPSDIVINIVFPDETIEAAINIRPYCIEMLETLSQYFELVVFTASHQSYADKVLDYLDPFNKYFTHRFFRESCIQMDENLYIKDLRIIGNRNLNDILLIDNAAYSYSFQIQNGVPIVPFYDNKEDKELLYLTNYLINIDSEEDIVRFNSEFFRLDLFQSYNSSEECLKEFQKLHL